MLSQSEKDVDLNPGFKIVIVLFMLSIGSSIVSFTKYSQAIPGIYELKYFFLFSFIFGLICLFGNKLIILNVKRVMILNIMVIFMIPAILHTDIQSIESTLLLIVLSSMIVFMSLLVFPNLSKDDFFTFLRLMIVLIVFIIIIPNFLYSFNKINYYSIGARIRFVGNFNNPNELARFSAVGFLIIARILPDIHKKTSKIVLLGLMIIALYIIYISDSRASLLLCGISIILFAFNWCYVNINKEFFLFFIIILVVVLTLLGSTIIIRAHKEFQIIDLDQLLSGRLSIWSNLLEERSFMELLFGTGSERDGLVATMVLTNGYLEIVMYYGIFGLFQWLSLIAYLLYKKVKIAKDNHSISSLNGVVIIIAFLCYYMFEGGLISIGNISGIYFWLELSQA